jgi:hypothetical protein
VHLTIFCFAVFFVRDADFVVFVVDMQRRLRQATERNRKTEPWKREVEPRKQAAEVRTQTIGEKTKQKADQIFLVSNMKT